MGGFGFVSVDFAMLIGDWFSGGVYGVRLSVYFCTVLWFKLIGIVSCVMDAIFFVFL
jgi:hypothetical protein